MKIAFHLLFHELNLLRKDLHALFLLFVMPAAFILFITLALKDVYLAKVGANISAQVVVGTNCDKENSSCHKIIEHLKSSGFQVQQTITLDKSLHSETILVFPPSIDLVMDTLRKGEKVKADQKMKLLFDPVTDHSVIQLIESRVLLSLQSVFIEDLAARVKDLQKKYRSAGVQMPDVINVTGVRDLFLNATIDGKVLPNPIQQTVPAWALFGMFFIVLPFSSSMIRDRSSGIFQRLLAMPVKKWQLMFGKIGAFFVINLLQFYIMLIIGLYVMPALTHFELDLHLRFTDVFIVTLFCALTATTYSLFVSCLVKTSEQASALGALSVVILAIFGGVMIPHVVMPLFMKQISVVSPLYWGLSSYQGLFVSDLPLSSLKESLFVLLGFSLFFVGLSYFKFHWIEE